MDVLIVLPSWGGAAPAAELRPADTARQQLLPPVPASPPNQQRPRHLQADNSARTRQAGWRSRR